MFIWLVLSLCVFANAQGYIRFCGDNTSVVALLGLDLGTAADQTPQRPLPRDYNADVSNNDQYTAVIVANFQGADFAFSVDLRTAIAAEAERRLAAADTEWNALSAVDKTGAVALCLNPGVAIFVGLLQAQEAIVRGLLDAALVTFRAYLLSLKLLIDQVADLANANDVLAIAAKQILIASARAQQRAVDLGFYVAYREQVLRNDTVLAAQAVAAYYNALATGAQTDRAAVVAALDKVIADWVLLRRSRWLQERISAEIEQLKTDLAANLEKLRKQVEENIRIAWEETKQAIRDWINLKLEQLRNAIAEALSRIRCDVGAVTIQYADNADGRATVTIGGLVCYATDKTDEEIKLFACASLRALFSTNVGVTRIEAYTCVSQLKRSLLDASATTGTYVIQGQDPNPPVTSSSSALVAGLFLALLALFHF
jgi:hypothetical protein